jgi:hypothetical protein
MNASIESKKAAELSLAHTVLSLSRHYLAGRRGLLLAVAALGLGLYFSWGWLAAVGVAPLLLAFAPCAAMCALGLCMKGDGGKSSATDSNPLDGREGK